MLLLKNEKLGKVFQLPQSLDDVNFEYVSKVVSDIKLAKHYCIVALLTTAKISDLIDNKNNHSGSTKFVLVKHREDCSNDIIADNRIVIVAPSDVFNGIDCNNTKNELSGFNIKTFVEEDSTLRMSILKGDVFKSTCASTAIEVIGNISGNTLLPTLEISTSKNALIIGYKIVAESSIIASTNISLKNSGTVEYMYNSIK